MLLFNFPGEFIVEILFLLFSFSVRFYLLFFMRHK